MDKKDSNMTYRHELKYFISDEQMEIIKIRLKGLMKIDSHAGEKGIYNICSMYFDDIYNRCYYENENGTDPREKYRIRIYNHSLDRISLECKRKERGKTLKKSAPLTLDQLKPLLYGGENRSLFDSMSESAVGRKFSLEIGQRMLHPVVLVDYDRIPYVYANGNVRITLDTHISSSNNVEGFITGEYIKRPIMPKGFQLLEVKYDHYLPDFIYRALQLDSLQQIAFSKYYLCRKYSL